MAQSIADQADRTGRSSASWRRLPLAVAVGSVVAVAGTEVIYLLARAAGLIDDGVVLPSILGLGPLSPASVATTALMAAVGAGILLAIVMTVSARPTLHFRIAATVLGALSLAMPATIPGPTAGMRAAMAAMHVAVWVACVGVVARAGNTVKAGGGDG
jgi:hypothetical protein